MASAKETEEVQIAKAQRDCVHDWAQALGPLSGTRCRKCDVKWDVWAKWRIARLEDENEKLRKKASGHDNLDLALVFHVAGVAESARRAIEDARGRVIYARQRYTIYPPSGSTHPAPVRLRLPNGVELFMVADFTRHYDGTELRIIPSDAVLIDTPSHPAKASAR